ncbi:methyltransferase domain-containing protein [Paenibacillus glycinis]|uniref:Methyltransferase domain-containing protein n=1 Tax=Paenibacillus glycinis TaxID=2697035 RepID=A0ABW9XZS6_9BACL|nr:methyltransferase domain-containing protein [Paenibacillus glycinis]NBD28201.1 methyltransferase domain-containing protein [Paenibacillus glycinis]
MTAYEWDERIAYLRNTRWLFYNDDYLEFLVRGVWKIDKPVKLVDYGCGYGYLGLKLLPLLPEGSSYTGIDKGVRLLGEARELFSRLTYPSAFIEGDIETIEIAREYDIALSHAFLLHMTEPERILRKMRNSVVNGGRVICFEPHWIGCMANFALEGAAQSSIIPLGVLQKLYETDAARTSKDGNIGMRLPILMSQLGMKQVGCRMSDRVNFLDQHMDPEGKEALYFALREGGFAQEPADLVEMVARLRQRGLDEEEAAEQAEAERRLAEIFTSSSWLTGADNMMISFGIVED